MTRKKLWQNSFHLKLKELSINKIPLKHLCLFFLAVTAPLSLMLAQPLWAVETKPQAPATQKSDGRKAIDAVKEEMKQISDNVSDSIDRDKKTLKKKLDKLRTPQEQEPATQKSDGPKVIDTVKKGMQQISDNVSESIDRDKKTLKKKLDTLLDKE